MNRSYSKIRHIQESNLRLEKRFINEDSLSSLSQLKKTFPNVDESELSDKWDEFMKAYKSCVGDKEANELKYSAGVMIPSCLLTIFGIVFSFGLVSVFSGAGCAAGTLLAGKSIKDIAQCIKSKL
jgi:hypothetical protein